MAVEILVGTDVHVLSPRADGRGVAVPAYVPNLQARCAGSVQPTTEALTPA